MLTETMRTALGLFLAAIAMAFALAGCGGGGGGGGSTGGGTPTGATLVAISASPAFPSSLPMGLSQQLTATGYYSDGTSQNITASVAWNSAATTVATVNTAGLAKGVAVGTTNITASLGGVASTNVNLTVVAAVLQTIAVTPAGLTISAGQTKQFKATGNYSDGTSQDLTATANWYSSNSTAVYPVTPSGSYLPTPGLYLGQTDGTSTITASSSAGFTTISGTTTLTVSNYIVSGTLSLLPAGNSVVLQNNGADNLTLTADGSFAFNSSLVSGSTYNVTVLTQPSGGVHPCTVVDGIGSTTTFVNSVQVVCGTAVGTLAGSGTWGSANGTGAAASFDWPGGVAVDAAGNVYVADSYNNLIRKITPAGVVSTFAGSGQAGSTNGTGTAASFSSPWGIAIDTAGNLYVADYGGNKIRKITSAGVVSTLAGTGSSGQTDGAGTTATFSSPAGVAVDATGNVYVADSLNSRIRKITSAGVVSTLGGTTTFSVPYGVAVDTAGNVYVADTGNCDIRKITPTGVVSTLAGTGVWGYVDGIGTAAQFNQPWGVEVDTAGNVYVADTSNGRIRKITPLGVVSTLAGSTGTGSSATIDGPALSATFARPSDIAVDTAGNLYVADRDNNVIRKITP